MWVALASVRLTIQECRHNFTNLETVEFAGLGGGKSHLPTGALQDLQKRANDEFTGELGVKVHLSW